MDKRKRCEGDNMLGDRLHLYGPDIHVALRTSYANLKNQGPDAGPVSTTQNAHAAGPCCTMVKGRSWSRPSTVEAFARAHRHTSSPTAAH